MEYSPYDLTRFLNIDVVGYMRQNSIAVLDADKIADHLAAVVISQEQISRQLDLLSGALYHDYQSRGITDLVVINVLNGATPTHGRIVWALQDQGMYITPDSIKVSRYGEHLHASSTLNISQEPMINPQSRHILLVEDLVDEGATAHHLLQYYTQRHPKSLRMVSLAQKPGKSQYQLTNSHQGVSYDYHAAINVGHHWLVGFGMDLSFEDAAGKHTLYRGLPFVAAANPQFLKKVGQLDKQGAEKLGRLLERAA